jgi:hypothetical protein
MVRIEFERKIEPKGHSNSKKEGLKEFLNIIPPEKRKKIKIKDFDEWYEKELEEKWRMI